MSYPSIRTSVRPRHALLGCALLLISSTAVAVDPNDLIPPDANNLYGFYRIGIDVNGVSPAAGQCLIQGDKGRGSLVRHLWNEPGGKARWCGFGSEEQMVANRQSTFLVVPFETTADPNERVYTIMGSFSRCLVATPSGQVDYLTGSCGASRRNGTALWLIDNSVRVGDTVYASIRNKVTNQCIVFGNNGKDAQPRLHTWANFPEDRKYCGLGPDGLAASGLGLFVFTRQTQK